MIKWAKGKYLAYDNEYPTHTKLVRFIISGGMAAGTNLGTLFVLTHFFSLWYLLSSCIAFLIAFGVSFTLQKYWTFRDHSNHRIRAQAGIYFIILILGLAANTLFMYVLVEYLGLHYLASAIISGIIIAFFNYLAYHHFVFHVPDPQIE